MHGKKVWDSGLKISLNESEITKNCLDLRPHIGPLTITIWLLYHSSHIWLLGFYPTAYQYPKNQATFPEQ